LTSPSKAIANGEVVDRPMSPGRRVNKIQKQLEFYFSVDNMMVDKFLQKCMDDHGWVKIHDILGFKRLKGLQATKELVTEAAFHSTLIEVDVKKGTDRIRMNKLWKQFVGRDKKQTSKSSSSSRAKLREKDLQKQKELDAADLNEDTIEAIVAAIEKKQERRERRHRERARQKEKARLAKEKETEDTASPKDDGSEPNDDDTKTPHELIIKDQQQGDDDTLPSDIVDNLAKLTKENLDPLTVFQIKRVRSLIDEAVVENGKSVLEHEKERDALLKETGNWLHSSVPQVQTELVPSSPSGLSKVSQKKSSSMAQPLSH